MRVAIMQPYFFPYIGYFQLMAACDVFLVYDDAQYIYGGWVNRNRILVNGTAQWLTVPVAGSRGCARQFSRDFDRRRLSPLTSSLIVASMIGHWR